MVHWIFWYNVVVDLKNVGMLNEEVIWSWDFAPDLRNPGVQLQASFCSKENAALSTTERKIAFCRLCEEYHHRPDFYVWLDKFVFNSISLQLSIELGGQDWSNANTSAMWRRKELMVVAWLSCSWYFDWDNDEVCDESPWVIMQWVAMLWMWM